MAPAAPPRFRIRFWGTRGTCPSPGPRTVRYGGNTPCLEVRGGSDSLVVLDAGTGIRALGAQLMHEQDGLPVHVLLTHRHGDHVLGLPHFTPLTAQTRSVTICCGDGEAASLQTFIDTLLSPPMFPYVDGMMRRLQLCEWPYATPQVVGDTRVHRFAAQHPGEAAIFRVDDSHGAALAYAPDNELAYHDTTPRMLAWRVQLIEWLYAVPVLVHDATYMHSELPRHRRWGHSSAVEATQLALDCKAGMVVLFHHHPDRDDDSIENMVEECRALVATSGSPLRVLAAWEGLALTV